MMTAPVRVLYIYIYDYNSNQENNPSRSQKSPREIERETGHEEQCNVL